MNERTPSLDALEALVVDPGPGERLREFDRSVEWVQNAMKKVSQQLEGLDLEALGSLMDEPARSKRSARGRGKGRPSKTRG